MFGDPARDAAIKSTVDTIWAQAGIDVQFLPNVVRYNDTFANQGIGLGVRPIGDLPLIITNAQVDGGVLHPDPDVLNMFFVNRVPGFDLKAPNWVNGVGLVGANGIAIFVGPSVTAEHAAHWVAHEIGHNLGLSHVAAGTANLMASNRNTELLYPEQIGAVLQSPFVEPLSGPVAGDYDRNGKVDASDYALWRNTLHSQTSLAADGNGNGIVDQNDLMIWRRNFGRAFAASAHIVGVAATEAAGEPEWFTLPGTPEPGSAALLLTGLGLIGLGARQRSRNAP
jgi:hypothetical protein